MPSRGGDARRGLLNWEPNMTLPSELTGQSAAQRPTPRAVEAYRNVHLWLLIPFAITLLGFSPSYFLKLGDASWHQHLHGISATLWFVLLLIQPYLATHGGLKAHRRFGIAGLMLAGLVIASALGVVPANIENANAAETSPLVTPTFLYGVSLFDLLSVAGFGIAVLMATLKIRDIDDHALWMLSTVFWVLAPGLTRLVAFSMLFTVGVEGVTLVDIIFWVTFPILAVIGGIMFWIRRAHPALVFALVGNSLALLVGPIGNTAWWRSFADALFM